MQLWNSQISILPAGLKTHSMDQHSALRPVIRLLASFSSVPPSSSSAFTGPWPQTNAASYFEYSSLKQYCQKNASYNKKTLSSYLSGLLQVKQLNEKSVCEIKLTFVPSCSQMRLQLLHFHAVFKTWPTFQELTSIVSFRKRRWSQRNFSENRNKQGNQSKDMLIMKDKDYEEIFFLHPGFGVAVRPRFWEI